MLGLRIVGITATILVVLFLATTRLAAAEPVPELWFFHAPGCRGCNEAKAAVNALEQRVGGAVVIRRIDTVDPVNGPDAVRRLFALLHHHHHRGATAPELAVFVGAKALYGHEAVVADLDQAVAAARQAGWSGPPAGAEAAVRGESGQLTLLAVSLAALADGVNPCAFATIVLLVSFLAVARRRRREIALIGATFAAGVFIAYLLLGLAVFAVLYHLSAFHVVSDLIFLLAFGICILGMLLCLWDASLAARGRRPGEMVLKLPTRVRDALHAQMRKGLRRRILVTSVFLTGLLVAILESVCTGQIYLPIIAGLVREGADRWRGLGLLIWYCALFILPLVVILGLALFGLTHQRLTTFGNRHWGLLKLLLALAFGLMALWMIVEGLPWPPGRREAPAASQAEPAAISTVPLRITPSPLLTG